VLLGRDSDAQAVMRRLFFVHVPTSIHGRPEALDTAEADRKKRRLEALLEAAEEGRLASPESARQPVLELDPTEDKLFFHPSAVKFFE
jgi:hypothetical protein